MPVTRLQIYVSTTVTDLGSYARAAAETLRAAAVIPQTADRFAPGRAQQVELLREQIRQCDAVICLVGFAFGGTPTLTEDPPRSYTQVEYDVARQLGKPIYVLLAADDCQLDARPSEDRIEQELQKQHRDALLAGDHVVSVFSSYDEVRRCVYEIVALNSTPPTHAPFEAYIGNEPYLFASYAHKDASLVYPELSRLRDIGYRIWYDEGIDPGNEWPDEIANKLDGASCFLVFVSPRAVHSKNVRNGKRPSERLLAAGVF